MKTREDSCGASLVLVHLDSFDQDFLEGHFVVVLVEERLDVLAELLCEEARVNAVLGPTTHAVCHRYEPF